MSPSLAQKNTAVTNLSYSHQEMVKDMGVVILIYGYNENGEKVYYYLSVNRNKFRELITIHKSGKNFDPESYGSTLASGWGEPSSEVKKYMEKFYNFNHNSELVLDANN